MSVPLSEMLSFSVPPLTVPVLPVRSATVSLPESPTMVRRPDPLKMQSSPEDGAGADVAGLVQGVVPVRSRHVESHRPVLPGCRIVAPAAGAGEGDHSIGSGLPLQPGCCRSVFTAPPAGRRPFHLPRFATRHSPFAIRHVASTSEEPL
jgi:hypothetical protein